MVIGAVRRLIMACRDVAGLMLVVDDAHVADEATVEVRAHLACERGRPFLVAFAYRPEQARPRSLPP